MKNYKTVKEFKDALDAFNKGMIAEVFPYTEKTGYTILDGPLSSEEYYKSKIKIVWVLKEGIDDRENPSDQVKYSDLLGKYWDYEEFLKGEWRTWHPIVFTSYGILNNFIKREEMPAINEKTMGEILHNISILNISKYSALNGRKTDMNALESIFRNSMKKGNWFSEQIKILEPDIVIFGFTFEIVKDCLQIKETDKHNISPLFEMTGVYVKDNTLYFDCWHPSKPIKKEIYCNEIIEGAKKCLERVNYI